MRQWNRILLLLFLFARSVSGEEDEVAAEEEAQEAMGNSFSVCEDSLVVVEDINVLCDSPGTYYYGSGKYRNSEKCQGGDKVKLWVDFYIAEELEVVPYVTIYVQGYGTVPVTNLYVDEEFCAVSSLSAETGECEYQYGTIPAPGYYSMQETFYFESQAEDDEYEYNFVPKVVIGFSSAANEEGDYDFDLGGANTNDCEGDTFMKWTSGIGAANAIRSFFLTFGLLVSAAVALMFAGWCIVRKASKNAPKIGAEEDLLDKDAEESNKVAMLGKNETLVNY